MKTAARLRRIFAAIGKGLLWTVGGLIGLVALVLSLGLFSSPGRALLARAGLGIANSALPGTIELGELERLGTSRLVLRDIVIRDAQGDVVVRAQKLTLDYDLGAIIRGRYVVQSAVLEQAWVDLRNIAEADRGIVSAFVDPLAPPSPPADPNAPSPYVTVKRAVVQKSFVRLPNLPELGQLDVANVEVAGSFLLDQLPQAALGSASLGIERAGVPLGQLKRLQGEWQTGGKASSAELDLELLSSHLSGRVRGVLPSEPGYADSPLEAQISLHGLKAQDLSTLLQNTELASSFQGETGLELNANGTPHDAKVKLNASTAGGSVRVDADVQNFDRAEVRLQSEGFRGAAVRADLPQEPLQVALTARADAADRSAIPVYFKLEKGGRLGEHVLPEVEANAVLTPTELQGLSLQLKDAPSKVRATGRVGFDGSLALDSEIHLESHTIATLGRLANVSGQSSGEVDAQITVERNANGRLSSRGNVSLRELVFADNRVKLASLSLNVQGQPPNLSGNVKLKAEGLRAAGQKFEHVELEVSGGPSRYHVIADVRDAELANRAKMTAKASLDLEWTPSHYGASGSVDGTLGDAPLHLKIAPSRYEPNRSAYQSEGISLRLGEQTLLVKGQAEPKKANVEVTSDGPIDLGLLSDLLPLDPPLSGKAMIQGQAHGSLTLPIVEVDAKLERVTLGERPPVTGDFRVTLDAAHGKLSFSGLVQASDKDSTGWLPLDLQGKLDHYFQAGPGYAKHLLRGRPEGHLELRALDLSFVEAWAGTQLPVTGHLGATLDAGGSFQNPTLALGLRSKLKVRGDPRTLDLDGDLSLRDERWETHLLVSDVKGRWLTLTADALTPASEIHNDPFVSRLSLLPAHGRWQIQIKAEPRPLSELPVIRLQELPQGTLAGHVELAHEPEGEPKGHIAVDLTQSGDSKEYQGCENGDLRMALEVDLDDAKWRARLAGRRHDQELFVSRASGRLELAPLLAGGALKLGPMDAELSAKALRLENLPYVCASARGELTAEVKVRDPLGASPELKGDVILKRFRASPIPKYRGKIREELLELEAHFAANAKQAELEAKLTSGNNLSTFKGHLPIHYQSGSLSIAPDAPLDAHLRLVHLSISPLLNPRGAVSYATGSLHGQVDLVGTRVAPRLSGTLEVEKVAFTASDLAQPLRDVQAKLVFSERDARLESFEAHDGDGKLNLEGQAHFQQLDRIDATFRVHAKEFPLRQLGQVVAHLELDADVKTLVLPERTDVEVGIHKADMWLENTKFRAGIALTPHPDFVVDGKTAKQRTKPQDRDTDSASQVAAAPDDATGSSPSGSLPSAQTAPHEAAARANQPAATEPAEEEPRVTHLVLKSYDRFWIKRDDFAVNLSANLDTEIAGERASVQGDVLIERGYLTLIGKTFEFERGSKLTFIGGASPDPVIDLTAAFNNRRTGDVVKVHITGRGSKPVIEFLINDKRGEAGDAFAAIYGSQGTNQSSKSAPEQAAGFVGGLTAGLLATSARRELGAAAPIIMIEPGDKAGEGRVRAGFELDSLVPRFLRNVITGVYVEGILSRESSGSKSTSSSSASVNYGVLLEFYYPRNFFSTAQYGPGSSWSLDLGWQL